MIHQLGETDRVLADEHAALRRIATLVAEGATAAEVFAAVASTDLVAAAISNAESRDRLHELAEEQAALRRIATLVAEGPTSAVVCAAVADEVVQLLGLPRVVMLRYDPGREAAILAAPGGDTGERWILDGPSVAAAILDTGRPARFENYEGVPGMVAAWSRSQSLVAGVGAPITVDGATWGAMIVGTRAGEHLAAGTEERLGAFTELVATAISNAESRERTRRLADEQEALRRVATLVAEGATLAALGAVVLEEVGGALGIPSGWLVRYEADETITVIASLNDPTFPTGSRWPLDGMSLSRMIADTGRPGRIDDYSALTGTLAEQTLQSGISSVAGAPIVVDGSLWGCICVGAPTPEQLPSDTEQRLRNFAELVATAISNAESHDRISQLADEQAALRRVATLVASGVSPKEVFAAVAEEVGRLLDLSRAYVTRYESGNNGMLVAGWSAAPADVPVGLRFKVADGGVSAQVRRTGLPARVEAYAPGPAADTAKVMGLESAVAAPISVEGSLWGLVLVGSSAAAPPPPGTEQRLAGFTELVATAIGNAQAREELRRIADEQAALRRVATLVATAASSEEVLAAVAEEAARVLELSRIEIVRYEADQTGTVIGASGDHPFAVGSSWPLDTPSVMGLVFRSGSAARIDDYSELEGPIAETAREAGFRAAIGAPIVVGGSTWGAVIAVSTADAIPDGAEVRLGEFTELVATALSNLQAHDDLSGLADEQAALRRMATLVAEGTDAQAVFDAVCVETAELVGATAVNLARYTPDGFNVTMAGWSRDDSHVPVGTRLPLTPDTVALVRGRGLRSSLGAPIVVDGQLWGALVAGTDKDEVMPAGTELRLARFTDLVATAISNAAARAELIASRARVVAAGDEARRRIERDLHDGTQQRLIALGLDLQRIRAAVLEHPTEAVSGLDRMQADLESVLEDVRELSRGLHPPLLSRAGLKPSLRVLARRSPIPVDLDVDLPERPSPAIETALYYIVSEALTNAIKHSKASGISITIIADHAGEPFGIGLDGRGRAMFLHATISDDGIGGADASEGSGLIGLVDRVDALGGHITLDSPAGRGTRVSVELPVQPSATLQT